MRKVGLLQNQALLPLLAYPHFDPHVNMSIISINSLSEFKEIVREVIYSQLERRHLIECIHAILDSIRSCRYFLLG